MTFVFSLLLAAALPGFAPAHGPAGDAPAQLIESVDAFWSALQARDKATAMRFVLPEDLNNFLNRQEAEFRNWSRVRIELLDENRADVVISFDRAVLGSFLKTEITEHWVRTDEGWRIRVDRPVPVAKRIFQTIEEAEKKELPPRLEVRPARLPFYGIAAKPAARLRILNGLDLPAEIVGLEYDTSMLTVEKPLKSVPPHTIGSILFRYSGPKLDKENVEGQIVLRIRQGDQTRTYEVPVVYNVINDLERWFRKQQQTRPPAKQPSP